jgi:hypothetical protein
LSGHSGLTRRGGVPDHSNPHLNIPGWDLIQNEATILVCEYPARGPGEVDLGAHDRSLGDLIHDGPRDYALLCGGEAHTTTEQYR